MTALWTLLLAGAPVAVVDTPAPQTLNAQQLFDQASAAAAKDDCTTAITLFETLEKRKVLKPGTIPAASVALRKGGCLIRVDRAAEGETAIEQGLPTFERAAPDFNVDVADAVQALGDAAANYHDYDRATVHYRRALDLRKDLGRVQTLARLARTTAFDQDGAALAYADEAIALISALPPKEQDKNSLATFHTLHARALLNQGKVQEGYTELKQALKLSGGLTSQTTLSQASMRADLGMAAALAGKKEEARLYLAYTGAGRLDGKSFPRGLSMDPPLCGEETGLRPDDVAVVEFAIATDGSVYSPRTVYSRGGRAVTARFAEAVSDWYWSPETIKDIPAFYRLATRVEMRCSMVGAEMPSVVSPAMSRFHIWAAAQLPELGQPASVPKLIGNLRDALARGDWVAAPAKRAAALGIIAASNSSPEETKMADAAEAMTAAVEARAPQEVVNWLRILSVTGAEWMAGRKIGNALRAMAAEPSFVTDPVSSATALMLAATSYRGSRDPAAPTMLEQVANDTRLPDRHPLRQAARIALANLAAAAGDGATAQRYFASTGLSEQQCALIGLRPALQRSGADSSDYPMEALRMGFEGWVNLEFDITADGRAAASRPIVAYPPLIFVDAASAMTKGFRYEASYRPEGGAACAANRQTIKFSLP